MRTDRSAAESLSRSVLTYVLLLVVITFGVSAAIAGTLIYRRVQVNRLTRNANDYHSATRLAVSRILSELALIRQNGFDLFIASANASTGNPSGGQATGADNVRRETTRSIYIIDQYLGTIEEIQDRFTDSEFVATTKGLGEAISRLDQATQSGDVLDVVSPQHRSLVKNVEQRCRQLDQLHANAFRNDSQRIQELVDSRIFSTLIVVLSGLGLTMIVLLYWFARQAVLRRDQVEQRLAERATQAELLYRAVTMSDDTKSFHEALQKCVEIVCKMTGWPIGHVWWPSSSDLSKLESSDIWWLAAPNRFEAFFDGSNGMLLERGVCFPGRIWQSGRPDWMVDARNEDSFTRRHLCEASGIAGGFGFPVKIQGRTVAVLEFFSIDKIDVDETLLLMTQSVGEQVGRVLERIEADELLRRQNERVERELNEAKAELVVKTRLAAIGQVSAQVAHEIRNPLGAISNAIYFLKRHAPVDPQKHVEYLDLISEEISTCNQFINDLLDITRRKSVNRVHTDLGELIAKVLVRESIPRNIDFQLHAVPDPFDCFVDRDQFVQVFQNLLNNSLDVLRETGGHIEILASRADGEDVIRFRDSGPGIPAEHRTSVFEVLFTTKSSGTGLGLAICRQIIERHGGTIAVVERQSGATEFLIRIPTGQIHDELNPKATCADRR